MQLEPGSVEGTASLVEHRIRSCVQGDMDKNGLTDWRKMTSFL